MVAAGVPEHHARDISRGCLEPGRGGHAMSELVTGAAWSCAAERRGVLRLSGASGCVGGWGVGWRPYSVRREGKLLFTAC